MEADYSIGESEQKAEMTFGDFGASVSASAAGRRATPSASEVYVRIRTAETWVQFQAGAEPGLGGLS